MRTLKLFSIASCLLLSLSACSTSETITPLPAMQIPETPTPMVGGYGVVDTNKQEIFEINKFMEAELNAGGGKQIWTKQILKAEKQVVSGTNYRLTVVMSDGNQYQAVIYKDLQGTAKLNSYHRI